MARHAETFAKMEKDMDVNDFLNYVDGMRKNKEWYVT